MASGSQRKGGVKHFDWWKNLRHKKRPQNKRVRKDGKKQIESGRKELE
jgi:hypothetical protein